MRATDAGLLLIEDYNQYPVCHATLVAGRQTLVAYRPYQCKKENDNYRKCLGALPLERKKSIEPNCDNVLRRKRNLPEAKVLPCTVAKLRT